MNTRKTILENQLKRYNFSYYKLSKSLISDVEYDRLYDELKELDPENKLFTSIGSDLLDTFPKARHLMVMGSQEKVKSKDQILEWMRTKAIDFPVVMELKYDGISIELIYENGLLKSAVTRGNATIGDEILDNVLKMKGVVQELDSKFTGSVRGEVLMDNKTFEQNYSEKFSNPRNLSSGIAKNKEGKHCEDLTIVCYDVAYSDSTKRFNSEEEKVAFLKENNFYDLTVLTAKNVEEILKIANNFKLQREGLPFPVDGVMIKQNDISHRELAQLRPDFQRAFKWDDIGVETILRDVYWSRSGITYTPIAKFDPIHIEGTTVSSASLANVSFIEDLDIAIGDTIVVSKRNMIIPKVEDVVFRPEDRQPIEFPKTCECCGRELITIGKKFGCFNHDCPGRKEHRLSKWISILNAKGFGTVLQKHLFNTGIHDIADLYNDEKVAHSKELTNLKENFSKAFNSLYSRKEIELSDFLAGFDIEGIGRKVFETLIHEGYDTLDKLLIPDFKYSEELLKIPNFGQERLGSLVQGLEENVDSMREVEKLLLERGTKIVCHQEVEEKIDGPLAGKKVCITGKLEQMSRIEAADLIKKLGGSFTPSVNKYTDILVTNYSRSGSSKAKAALRFGTKTITEKTLIKMDR